MEQKNPIFFIVFQDRSHFLETLQVTPKETTLERAGDHESSNQLPKKSALSNIVKPIVTFFFC